MKKFYLLTLSLMMFLPVSVMAQNKIKGTILESKSSLPLPFSTIAIYESDTVLVAGTTSDDNGLYEISNIKSGDYRVEASFIGYKTSTSHISINNNSVTLDFALEQDTEYLEGAKVSARKPLIEMKVDKIVMNVADAVATQGSNAKEILRKAPGVSIDMEGNVKLNGSAVAVWIDGRPSHLSGKSLEAFLESTDGATIDRIEVMAHPSSKYDAQGSGGIIDIKTKKNFLQG
ncbi:MAG: TonB-dependent receptor, partial [Bacteroidales bacterium]|nr:TonB-dependent receptor [Bacteroidales bacterium]